MKKVFAHLLPLDTKIVDDDNYRVTDIGEETCNENRSIEMKRYYLVNLVEMPKPSIDSFIDSVGEEMNENCEDWFDKNQDCLEPLRVAFQDAFDKRWGGLQEWEKTVFSLDTEVDFSGMPGYIED